VAAFLRLDDDRAVNRLIDTTAAMTAAPVARASLEKDIACAVRSDVTVLIAGGTDRTREAIGRLIHQQRAGRDDPFVVADPRRLSEVFLVGAAPITSRLAEWIPRGTVFIAEVCDLSAEIQAGLLRFLEERSLPRGRGPASVDVRLMAATAHPVFERVTAGTFSVNLYYLLNLIHLVVPSE
jgi:DNA-binding NtrC family response regulator